MTEMIRSDNIDERFCGWGLRSKVFNAGSEMTCCHTTACIHLTVGHISIAGVFLFISHWAHVNSSSFPHWFNLISLFPCHFNLDSTFVFPVECHFHWHIRCMSLMVTYYLYEKPIATVSDLLLTCLSLKPLFWGEVQRHDRQPLISSQQSVINGPAEILNGSRSPLLMKFHSE